jgi:23S rRNA pseudouridine2605 synthase
MPKLKAGQPLGRRREEAGPAPGRRPIHGRSRSPNPRVKEEPAGGPLGPMRIAKAMARAGLCSRRDAERWILAGRVTVNGEVLRSPARDVGPNDVVTVDGRPLPNAEPVRLWRYYKPKGLVTTHRDPERRPTVFDHLPKDMPRVISVGRLDYNTEGLLLLTTDGALARHLELPATGWLRRYRVRAHGRVAEGDLDKLKEGIELDGVRYGPIEATLDRVQGSNVWLTIGLREGKNREVRNVLASLGLQVNRLIRISFGPFQLLDLEPGAVEPVKRRVLADQLGPKWAQKLGLVEDKVAQAGHPRAPAGAKPKIAEGRGRGRKETSA